MDNDVTRYNLILPTTEFKTLRDAAKSEGLTIATLLRRFIKLGLFILNNPNAELVLHENGKQTRLILF